MVLDLEASRLAANPCLWIFLPSIALFERHSLAKPILTQPLHHSYKPFSKIWILRVLGVGCKINKSASESEEAPLNERGEKEGAGLTPTKHLKFRIVHLSGCHRKAPVRLKDKDILCMAISLCPTTSSRSWHTR